MVARPHAVRSEDAFWRNRQQTAQRLICRIVSCLHRKQPSKGRQKDAGEPAHCSSFAIQRAQQTLESAPCSRLYWRSSSSRSATSDVSACRGRLRYQKLGTNAPLDSAAAARACLVQLTTHSCSHSCLHRFPSGPFSLAPLHRVVRLTQQGPCLAAQSRPTRLSPHRCCQLTSCLFAFGGDRIDSIRLCAKHQRITKLPTTNVREDVHAIEVAIEMAIKGCDSFGIDCAL